MRIVVEKGELKAGTSKAGKPWKLYAIYAAGGDKYTTFSWSAVAPGIGWDTVAPGVALEISYETVESGEFTNYHLKTVEIASLTSAPPVNGEQPAAPSEAVRLSPVTDTELDPVMVDCMRQARILVDRMIHGAPPVQEMYWVVQLACALYRDRKGPAAVVDPLEEIQSDPIDYFGEGPS